MSVSLVLSLLYNIAQFHQSFLPIKISCAAGIPKFIFPAHGICLNQYNQNKLDHLVMAQAGRLRHWRVLKKTKTVEVW